MALISLNAANAHSPQRPVQANRAPVAQGICAEMSFKSILIHVEPSSASKARLSAVVAFAAKLDAELVGLGGRAPLTEAVPLAADLGGGYGMEASAEADAALLADAEAQFRKLAPAGVWRSTASVPIDALCEHAAGADLIVTGLELTSRNFAPDPAQTVLRAGLPVIAVPEQHPQIAFERIVIAWKDTREARRAVGDALPLLRRAREVTVLSVTEHKEPASPSSMDNLVGRLARHGVAAAVKRVSSKHDPGAKLIDFALSRSADLIVAGAFGHSRAGEWLLGGMTQSLLARSTLPVLFSH